MRLWLAILGLAFGFSEGARGLNIIFDYTYDTSQFFSGPNLSRRAELEQVALQFENRLQDHLAAIEPGGGNSFTESFVSPGTGEPVDRPNPVIAADTLVIYVGGMPLDGGALAVGGPGGFGVAGTSQWLDNVIGRGQTGATGTEGQRSDFAAWGGTIAFNSASAWYFDSDLSTVESFPDQYDFYGIASHELAHVLGFGNAWSWRNQISGQAFTGPNAVAVNGGNVPLYANLAHWEKGVTSTVPGSNTTQPADMGPEIGTNERKYFTDLDWAGLKDIGWEVDNGAPVPPSIRRQPAEVLAELGGEASFSVQVEGTQPLSYQWQFNGVDLPGATDVTLTLKNLGAEQAGPYRMVVKNAQGTDTSHEANLGFFPASYGALPPPWKDGDIGAPALAGSAGFNADIFQVKGSGNDIWDTRDAFHFVYQVLEGNGEIQMQVLSQTTSDVWAKAGAMIRESTAADARHAMMAVTPGNGASFQFRANTGGASQDTTPQNGIHAPYWVRLKRQGDLFTGYDSPDGAVWRQIGSTTLAMSSTVNIGLCVTAHNTGVLGTVRFGHVRVISEPGNPTPGPAGTLRWEFATDDRRGCDNFPAVGPDGTVYFGAHGNPAKVYAVDGTTGRKRWSVPVGNSSEVYSSPVLGTNGLLYIASMATSFYALNAADGSQVWTYPSSAWGSAALANDGTVCFGSGSFCALDPQSGKLRWRFALPDGVMERGAPAIDGEGNVYFGIKNERFYSLDPQGRRRWTYKVIAPAGDAEGRLYGAPAITDDGRVIFGSFNNSVYFLNTADGGVWWEFKTGGSVWSTPALDAQHIVYVGSDDGNVYALDYLNKVKKWAYSRGAYGRWDQCSAPLLGANGDLFIGAHTKVVCLNRADGAFKWAYDAKSEIKTSPAIGADGTLYVTTWDGRLLALWTDATKGLYPAAWPKYGHDSRNSGLFTPSGPTLITQPAQQFVAVGDTAVFGVTVAPGSEVTYQWRFNDTPIDEATGPELILTSVRKDQQGSYGVWVSNDRGTTKSASALLTVNSRPTVSPLAHLDAPEGVPTSASLTATDIDGQTLRYRFEGDVPSGAVIDANSGRFSWTPDEAQGPGVYPLAIVVSDSGTPSLSATQILTVAVSEVNVAPRLAAIADQQVNEGSTLTLSVVATDADVPANRLTYQLSSGAPAGAVFDPDSGVFAWTPSVAQSPGAYPITVQVIDDGMPALSDARTFTVAVAQITQAPAITSPPQKLVVTNGATAVFRVAATGTAPLQYQWFLDGHPIPGATDPELTITPVQTRDTGLYTVTVTNLRGTQTSAAAGLTINTPPTAVSQSLSTDEDVPLPVVLTGGDPDGDSLNYQLASRPTHGIITGTSPNLVYTPETNYFGPDSFSFTANDGWVDSAPALIAITVKPVNDAPVMANMPSQTVTEGATVVVQAIATDADLPTNRLSFSLEGSIPAGAYLDALTGRFTWMPSAAQAPSTNAITLRVSDDGAPPMSSAVTFLVFVEKSVMPPTIVTQPGDLTVGLGDRATFRVEVSGTAPFAYQWLWNQQPLPGETNDTLVLGSVTASQAGSYAVQATNPRGSATSSNALLRINSPPVALPQSLVVDEDAALSILLGGTDPNGDALSYQLASRPTHGTLTGKSPDLVYTPETNYFGSDSFSFTVNDGWGDSAPALIAITVKPVNDAPVMAPVDDKTIAETQLLKFSVAATDVDADQTLTYALGSGAPAGAAIDPAKGEFTWTPTEAQGPSTNRISIVASDHGSPSLSTTRSFWVWVTEVNTAPTLQPIPSQTVNQGDTLRLKAVATDDDLPPNRLTFLLGPGFPAGVRIDATSGEILWSLAADESPVTHRVTVIVTDDGVPAYSASNSFTVVVNQLIKPPVILTGPQSQTVLEGAAAAFAVAATGDAPLSYQWRKGGVPIAGATNAGYEIRMTQLADAGNYSVTVANAARAVDSLPAQLLVQSPGLKPAILEGQITDALDGAPVSAVSLTIGGYDTRTDATGWYRFTNLVGGPLQADFDANVRAGNAPLTVRFFNQCAESTLALNARKTGYLSYTNARVNLQAGETSRLDFSLSPANISGLRFVLNWGAKPRDLDAHLLVPPIQSMNYEVSYNARGTSNAPPYALLDIDRTDGFGPETISVTRLQAGVYRYYVHNFQDEQGDTGPFSDSGATVQIYTENGLVRTIQAPRAGAGDYWDVATIDGMNGAITVRNIITPTRPSRANLEPPGEDPGHPAEPGGDPASLTRYRWDFGDGTTSAEENPSKRYDVPGTYDVSLLVQKEDGRQDILVKKAFVAVSGTSSLRPVLSLRRAGTSVVASWTSTQTGWVLESKTRLSDVRWEPVTPAPAPNNGANYSVTLPLATEGYFRLKTP